MVNIIIDEELMRF